MDNFTQSLKHLSLLENDLCYIKAEFEAEGTRSEELAILRAVVTAANTELAIKIGGPFAFRDIAEAHQLKVKHIIVPMIESKEVCNLFLKGRAQLASELISKRRLSSFLINIETEKSFKNIHQILDLLSYDYSFKGIIIGRSDLSSSINIKGIDIESPEVFSICAEILKQCKIRNQHTTLGGRITICSYENIMRLIDLGLDSFETRKCCFKVKDYSKIGFDKLVKNALSFESNLLELYEDITNVYSKKMRERILDISNRYS